MPCSFALLGSQNLATPTRPLLVATPSTHVSSSTTLSSRQEQKFASLVQGFVVRGEWVKMIDFLKAVEEPRAHTKLYLDGKTPLKVWKVGSKLPRVKKDWDMLKGPRRWDWRRLATRTRRVPQTSLGKVLFSWLLVSPPKNTWSVHLTETS